MRTIVTHVIYDMDGLLLDTEPFYTQVTQKIVERYGKTFDWSLKSQMIGKKAIDAAAILTAAMALPMTPMQYLREREAMLEELLPQAQPKPGAIRLTHHLHACGILQAVATSSDRRLYSIKTSRHSEWFAIFDIIVTGDDPSVAEGKPAPDIYRVAAARLQAEPNRCLVFEDAPAGVAAALAAGLHVVAVPDPGMDPDQLAAAHQVLPSLNEFNPTEWGLPAF
jgi:HAD superfamily hydrolase (TIGR01509 family)